MNIKHRTLNAQHRSKRPNISRSVFDVRCSMFDVFPFAF